MAHALVPLASALFISCGEEQPGPTSPPPTPQPTSLSIAPASVSLAALGGTVQLAATVLDERGAVMSGVTVIWATSDASVAAVDGNGLVTAVANGTANVAASAGAASDTVDVVVAQLAVEVTLTPASDTLVARGDTVRLAASAFDANDTPFVGARFVWASSDATVATVDSTGLVTSASPGEAAVTATSDGATGGMQVTVLPLAPTEMRVTPDTVVMSALGETVQLAATVFDQLGREMEGAEVSWSSGDDAVVTVDASGRITAVGAGTATVTAVSGTVSVTTTVSMMQIVDSVAVVPMAQTITTGDTLRLVAQAFDTRGNPVPGARFSWRTSDPAVATVDTTGLVRGIAEGTVVITAQTGDLHATAQISVDAQVPGGTNDRAALVEFYRATGGPTWSRRDNWLSDAPLGQWYGVDVDEDGRVVKLDLWVNNVRGRIPPELGSLAHLRFLGLTGNRITGSIPPELGNLGNLEYLSFFNNRLTGVIPSELGNLANLRTLRLVGNRLTGSIPGELGNLATLRELHLTQNLLTGSIPPELGDLSVLNRLELSSNQLTGPIPPELGNLVQLEQMHLRYNGLTGSIPPEVGDLGNLRQLWLSSNRLTGSIPHQLGDLANLKDLLLSENRLTGSIPPEFAGLTSLRYMGLSFNQLTGSVPRELGDLANLEDLLLSSNRLSGAIPEELGRLVRLNALALANNSELSGPLPSSLTALLELEALVTTDTGLCAPTDPDFQTWLEAIPVQHVAPCPDAGGLPLAYLTQAVQSRTFPVPLVAGDPALLRVFVTATRSTSARIPPVRATFYRNGAETYAADIPARETVIPTEVEEGMLTASANAVIPGEVIRPDLEVVVEIDPEKTLETGLLTAPRIPATGRLPLDVREVPSLDLTLIPFLWSPAPDSTILDVIAGMAADPAGHELLQDTRVLLPVGDLTVTAHEPVLTSSVNAFTLLDQVAAIRTMEGASNHYMGLLSRRPTGLFQGLSHLPGRASITVPDASLIAHHLGHNMSLRHAPCGNPGGADLLYPYRDGSIGAWGHDLRDGGRLIPPTQPDLMSNCRPHWISDYHFSKVLRTRIAEEEAAGALTNATDTRSLLVWGGVDESGEPYLQPAIATDAPASLPAPGSGRFQLTGRTDEGDLVFSLRFDMPEVAESDTRSSFSFALPVETGWEMLASIVLSGPGGTATLDADTNQPVVILREPRSGLVRAFLRDPSATILSQVTRGADALPGQELEVLFSRGIPDADAWWR